MAYEIKERLLNGLETAGYVLLNGENGAEKVLKTSDVMKLAEAGMVQGASVVKAGGEKYLDIEGYGKIPVVRKLQGAPEGWSPTTVLSEVSIASNRFATLLFSMLFPP